MLLPEFTSPSAGSAGQPLRPYTYRDFGSLVSLGKWTTVGNLMGFLFGRGIFVEGVFAQIMYRSLRLLHERALNGTARAVSASSPALWRIAPARR